MHIGVTISDGRAVARPHQKIPLFRNVGTIVNDRGGPLAVGPEERAHTTLKRVKALHHERCQRDEHDVVVCRVENFVQLLCSLEKL